MTRDEIYLRMKELLPRLERVKVDADSIDEDSRLDEVGFDSLSILEYMYELETDFGIEMDVAELAGMKAVRDLVDHVAAKVREKVAQ